MAGNPRTERRREWPWHALGLAWGGILSPWNKAAEIGQEEGAGSKGVGVGVVVVEAIFRDHLSGIG